MSDQDRFIGQLQGQVEALQGVATRLEATLTTMDTRLRDQQIELARANVKTTLFFTVAFALVAEGVKAWWASRGHPGP